MTKYYLFIISALLLIACGDNAQKNESTTESPDAMEMSDNKYTVTPFDPSPSFEDAEILDMKFEDGFFSFDIGGESYKLGEQTSDAPQKMCANSAKGPSTKA